jgi:hypothetical protein
MRKAAITILLAFAVTVAVVVGNRMSAEAMAVVIGVVCGVAAAIPMSLLILLVSRRRDRRVEDYRPHGQPTGRDRAYPPVVVIQGGSPAPGHLQPPYYNSSVEAAPRQFHIVGEDE